MMYDFRGGPYDGTRQNVRLNEVPQGLAAPSYWFLQEPIAAALPVGKLATIEDFEINDCCYQFVPEGSSINRGFYRYIER